MEPEIAGKVRQLSKGEEGRLISLMDKYSPQVSALVENPNGFKEVYNRIQPYEASNQTSLNDQRSPYDLASKRSEEIGQSIEEKQSSMIEQITQLRSRIPTRDFAKLPYKEKIALLQVNMEKASVQIDRINSKQSFTTSLPQSTGKLLLDKAKGIRRDIQSLHKATGTEIPNAQTDISTHPIKKFFGYLTHGQTSLQELQQDLKKIDSKSFSMGQMLGVQIKVLHIQQELDFFANVLNKSLESTKNLMNVQI
jgi:hypothetical protein